MRKRVVAVLTLTLIMFCSVIGLTACGEPEHTHEFNQKDVSEQYLAIEPTCEQVAEYYYSCSCGEKGYDTFCFGRAYGHDFNDGFCRYCDERKASEGLDFTLINEGTEYVVSGLGVCEDKEIIIPKIYRGKEVVAIGFQAFKNCKSLTNLVIQDNITEIQPEAFYGCTSLISIEMPNTIKNIGASAFSSCNNLKYNIKDNLKYLGSVNNNYSYLIETATDDVVGTLIIDNNCIVMCDAVFNNTSITSVVIGENLRNISKAAFSNCTSLESVFIGDSVVSIDYLAFYKCSSLSWIAIPKSVAKIDGCAFEDCKSLTIYCEAKSKPSGWHDWWNYSDCPVVWDYKGN